MYKDSLKVGSQYDTAVSIVSGVSQRQASYCEPFQRPRVSRARGDARLGKISIRAPPAQRPSNQIARRFHMTNECVFIGVKQSEVEMR